MPELREKEIKELAELLFKKDYPDMPHLLKLAKENKSEVWCKYINLARFIINVGYRLPQYTLLSDEDKEKIRQKEPIKENIHWLYDTFRRVQIDKETQCKDCLHRKVCHGNNSNHCVNYYFGRSDKCGCESCINHYARFDEKHVPCFYCLDFIATPLAHDKEQGG